MEQDNSASGGKPDIVSLVDVFKTMYRQRILIVSSAAVATVVALAIALTLPPVYRAKSVLFPSETSLDGAQQSRLGQLGGSLGQLFGGSVGGDRKTQMALAVVESNSFTNSFIKENNLLPVLFADQWDASSGKWKDGKSNAPTLWQGVKLFEDDIRQVLDDKTSGTVTIVINWGDPVVAANWANSIVTKLNEDMRRQQIERSAKNVDYLKRALVTEGTVAVRDAISRLLELELRNVMVVQNQKEYVFRVIDPAVVPEEPISPNKILIIFLGGVMGLTVGGLAALARVRV